MDISYNSYKCEDMLVIGDGLRENHTILGFHTEGNSANVDAIGFVMPIVNARGELHDNIKQK